jgi:hypothetical protein
MHKKSNKNFTDMVPIGNYNILRKPNCFFDFTEILMNKEYCIPVIF